MLKNWGGGRSLDVAVGPGNLLTSLSTTSAIPLSIKISFLSLETDGTRKTSVETALKLDTVGAII